MYVSVYGTIVTETKDGTELFHIITEELDIAHLCLGVLNRPNYGTSN